MTLVRYGLPLLTAVVYGILVIGLGLSLSDMAGGLQPFDLRWQGYDLADTQAYLAALSDAGRALYLGPIRLADPLGFVVDTQYRIQNSPRRRKPLFGIVPSAV